MKKLEFTQDDFPAVSWDSKASAAFDANARLAEMLKEAKVVYSCNKHTVMACAMWSNDNHPESHNTHRALLINVEELPKPECKHEPAISLGNAFNERAFDAVCKHCGAPLEAIGWKEATR